MVQHERSIHAVADTLKNARTGCALLVGAGVSVSAGIPLASGFVSQIGRLYPELHRLAEPKSYQNCMGQLAVSQRHLLIKDAVDTAKINWAHVAMAQLIKAGYISRILTTNFDPLVARACAVCGVFPAVYDFAACEKFRPEFVVEPAVYHLHGQHSGFVQLHTEEEVKQHFRRLKPVFEDAGMGRPWIVIGYSGDNDPVFDHLARVNRFNGGLYWIGYRDEDPPEHVRTRLLERGKDAWYVKGHDADSFFVQIARALNCFPPDFVDRPLSHIKGVLGQFTDFRLNDRAGPNIVGITNQRLDEAIQQFEAHSPAADALRVFFEGDNQKLEQFEAALGDTTGELMKIRAWGATHEGVALATKAEGRTNCDADKVFELAYASFNRAVEIDPTMHEAFNNWGVALLAQAKTKSGESAFSLFERAGEKFARAVDIKADSHNALYNWGSVLTDQAEISPRARAKQLLELACEKYRRAVEIRPDMHEAFHNWGLVLLGLARAETDGEADRLFELAGEKFARAVEIKPDKRDAVYNWGNTLMSQALRKSGSEADRLFELAGEKFARVVELQPDSFGALINWGISLSGQALTRTDGEADRLFERANEKFARGVAVQPSNPDGFYNWGHALLRRSKTKRDADASSLLEAARNKFRTGEELRSGSCAYGCACVEALTGNSENCRQQLYTARAHGMLPPPRHLLSDEDLAPVRSQEWFAEFAETPHKDH